MPHCAAHLAVAGRRLKTLTSSQFVVVECLPHPAHQKYSISQTYCFREPMLCYCTSKSGTAKAMKHCLTEWTLGAAVMSASRGEVNLTMLDKHFTACTIS